ncbi:MAG TPA: hypothetical protein VGJ20_28960 [Xanthobacteraceae bacterium]|jgi:hypothetical protein
MKDYCPPYLLSLFLVALSLSWSMGTPAQESHFLPQFGGYQVSTDFRIDNHVVIYPPDAARSGDLLSVRPLRLNNDEYLVLQKCVSPNCGTARVIRAWNALGHMGPDLITSILIPIKPGATYMLWMQRIATKGGNSFSAYQRDSAPLVFIPVGRAELFEASDLKRAREQGPTRVQSSSTQNRAFVATFEGGSVVHLQLLRGKTNAEGTDLR